MILTDNGKVLMSPNGKAYTGNLSGGSSKIYNHEIFFTDFDCEIRGYVNLTLSTNTPITTLSQLYNIFKKEMYIPCYVIDEERSPDSYVGILKIYSDTASALELSGTAEYNEYQHRYHDIVDFRITEDIITEV